ncbi:hypothetical protein COCNU_scaffold003272G000020 [Cocos nucifera]|nr:hypothetical protein [Cocos nucifera]
MSKEEFSAISRSSDHNLPQIVRSNLKFVNLPLEFGSEEEEGHPRGIIFKVGLHRASDHTTSSEISQGYQAMEPLQERWKPILKLRLNVSQLRMLQPGTRLPSCPSSSKALKKTKGGTDMAEKKVKKAEQRLKVIEEKLFDIKDKAEVVLIDAGKKLRAAEERVVAMESEASNVVEPWRAEVLKLKEKLLEAE